ncbi:MAG: efflux transporter periplasmic adaptor subunit [Sphingomonas taxi]|uniref:Efflux transporter periplasmic adaptor subunit n=1 Tax=Sphingomonas taxi TaxID=1549858 RepID=A0A2W5PCS5_9SPHN|nr:MAG: efflux transporter periplasmic adaptor subunit [Sphingomonas taxi]
MTSRLATLRRNWPKAVRILVTLLVVALGVLVVVRLYTFYTYAPQTRDGKVRADVIPLAADVSGRITRVLVRDNQMVEIGQVLLEVDRERLANALARADAAVGTARANLIAARREAVRYRSLDGVVARQDIDTRRSTFEAAAAAYDQAVADRELARINLERSLVRAPVAGQITNFSLRPGSWASQGSPLFAIVDRNSFYVTGYFEETKLRNVHVGSRAVVHVMGEPRPITGHVSGLAAGIDDRERTTGAGTLLANVNPTFTWIRLAQRVPVRVAIDRVPNGVRLISGRTATVTLEGAGEPLDPGLFR